MICSGFGFSSLATHHPIPDPPRIRIRIASHPAGSWLTDNSLTYSLIISSRQTTPYLQDAWPAGVCGPHGCIRIHHWGVRSLFYIPIQTQFDILMSSNTPNVTINPKLKPARQGALDRALNLANADRRFPMPGYINNGRPDFDSCQHPVGLFQLSPAIVQISRKLHHLQFAQQYPHAMDDTAHRVRVG